MTNPAERMVDTSTVDFGALVSELIGDLQAENTRLESDNAALKALVEKLAIALGPGKTWVAALRSAIASGEKLSSENWDVSGGWLVQANLALAEYEQWRSQ